MKTSVFWEKRFDSNNFCNIKVDKNLSPFKELKEIMKENLISTNLMDDKQDKDNYIILCFLNIYIFSLKEYIKLFINYPKNKKYFFIFEPKVVSPLNYLKIFHYFFDKVFTRNDSLVDNKKYFKFIYPSSLIGFDTKIKNFQEKKLLTLINGNKASFIKNELYSEREKVIKFCERNNIEFDLYGTNWDRKNNLKQKIFGFKNFTSYRGKVDDKLETLSNYKFNICFENMKNTPGYITEKIWDSFKAKSVPIYWGASNITEYIPENCFIDFRKFDGNYDKLIDFISKMNEVEYNKIIENIEKFLKTEQAQKWFDKKWAIDFIKQI